MIREANLISYLPQVIQNYQEIKAIVDAENPEFNLVFDTSETVLNNQFIEHCDLEGIKRFEKLMNIRPSPNDNLDTRIFRVLSRWNDRVPYTWRTLIEKLDALCGKNNYTLQLLNNEYKINLETHLGIYGSIDELNYMLDVILPCNLVITANNTLQITEETPLYFGCSLIEGVHYVLSSDMTLKHSISSESYVASRIVDSSKYQLTSDIVTTENISSNSYEAGVTTVGLQYEIS